MDDAEDSQEEQRRAQTPPRPGRLSEAQDLIATNRAAVNSTMRRISGQLTETKAQLSTDHARMEQTEKRIQDTQAHLAQEESAEREPEVPDNIN